MDSHHTEDWKCMLVYTSIPLRWNILHVLPAMKWPQTAHTTNTTPPAFDDTQRHNETFTHHQSSNVGFLKHHTQPMHISFPLPSLVEAMNNTSFVILLQEICNTWNRMQYVVYLRAWRTQGASVPSVCVGRRERKNKEQRKQDCVTSDSPSSSWSNYSPSWSVGFRCWEHLLCVSAHLKKGCVIFWTRLCALRCFWT